LALLVDWPTGVISVLQADLIFVSGTLYEHDTDAFRVELIALEDNEDGIVWPRTHNHSTSVAVAGDTFARIIEIVAPYSITYENTGSDYSVRLAGSNNNLFDVDNLILNPTPGVTIIGRNSAGLIESGVSGLTSSESADLAMLRKAFLNGQRLLEGSTGNFEIYDDGGTIGVSTPLFIQDVTDKDGNPIVLPVGAPAIRTEAST